LELVCEEGRGGGVLPLLCRDELEEVGADVEEAGGGVVLQRDGHAAFAGGEAVIADGDVAEPLAESGQVGGATAAGPDADELGVRPVVAGAESIVALGEAQQLAGSAGIVAGEQRLQDGAD